MRRVPHIETVRRRVDSMGTAEATVVRQGRSHPGAVSGSAGYQAAQEILGSTAKLTFHAVHPTVTAEEAKQTRVPLGYKVYPSDENPKRAHYVLQDSARGDRRGPCRCAAGLRPADKRTGHQLPLQSFGCAQIRQIHDGQRRFSVRHRAGQQGAVGAGHPLADPRRPGQISGSFTVECANALAVQLRSGSLPAKLTIVEERTVGPSLGADTIEAGKVAGFIGGVAIVVLTMLAYGTFGVYAVIGLIVHGILIMALMSIHRHDADVAGHRRLHLTLAMAVDANVLIYERIREELRAGKSRDRGDRRRASRARSSPFSTASSRRLPPRSSCSGWAPGPIRGFAVTLTLGILTSVFAAVTVTRLLGRAVAEICQDARAEPFKSLSR